MTKEQMTDEEKEQRIKEFNDFFSKAHTELRQLERHLENELERVRELIKTTPYDLFDVAYDDMISNGNDFSMYLAGFGAAKNEKAEAEKIQIANFRVSQENHNFMQMMYNHLREAYKDDPDAKGIFLEFPFIHYLTETLENRLEDQYRSERVEGLTFNDAILPFFKGYVAGREKILKGDEESDEENL